ncbi:hypothetical protein [Niabella ginsengisoli]|uniref:Uncharacterized protein n=1 Tax=Niabella ginsengisoli TaxID=522298 RepID=A0ABS9SKV9_9BACT|nr:hypothetical protein [Niabella ginsengisoli]MCH5598429.1 hypothetical protein [Niabella ginsengisoli]MCH5599023.1 hypothetical protein [Niabella ginsengisoli]
MNQQNVIQFYSKNNSAANLGPPTGGYESDELPTLNLGVENKRGFLKQQNVTRNKFILQA